MTREEASNLALSRIDNVKCLVLQLGTGFGKSKIAIDCTNKICNKVTKRLGEPANVLILVSKITHKKTWKEEIQKWGGLKTDNVALECYESLKKYQNKSFDVVICDEAQHLSEKRLEYLKSIKIDEVLICLSATLKRELCYYLKSEYKADFIKCDIKEAIEDDVLPEPTIYLLPLKLNNSICNYRYKKFKNTMVGTQLSYYNNLCSLIEFYKNKFYRTRNDRMKNMWMRACTDRLKWLSEQKENVVIHLLNKLKDVRTLTFCSSIDQTERLGKYCINSKNSKSLEYLDMFNNKEIKHITSCNILNESVNLVDCRVGIFCNLNASDVIVKQRNGRLLRHKRPIIIVPYFSNTREEQLVTKVVENYKENSVITVKSVEEIVW